MKKWIVLFLLVAVVAAGGYTLRERKSKADSEETAALPTAEAHRGPIRLSVASTGRVISNLDVDIKCKASGEVITLPYDISDPVKKGDLLVELDPIDEQRFLSQAEAELSSSKARLAQSKLNLETARMSLEVERKRDEAALKSAQAKAADAKKKAQRYKDLLLSKGVSNDEYETAETTYIQAQADADMAQAQIDDLKVQEKALETKEQDVALADSQVKSDEVGLELAQQRLTDTKVYAPMDGVVSARDVQIGQIIASPISNVSGGTSLLTLSDLSRLFVVASVDESDIGVVKVGQSASITVDAFPDDRFFGKVVQIATQGQNVSNVVTFEVKIEVLSPNKDLLKPEMTASVDIVAGEKDDALLVPSEALYRKKGQQFVALAGPNGEAGEEKPVEVGIDNGIEAEILGGLSEGEKVTLEVKKLAQPGSGRPGGPPMMMMMRGGGGKR